MKQKLIMGLLFAGIILGAVVIMTNLFVPNNDQTANLADNLQTAVAPTYSISGQVKPASGQPVLVGDTPNVPAWYFVDAKVVCSYIDSKGKLQAHEDQTDGEGRYTIVGIPKGVDCVLTLVEKTVDYWGGKGTLHFIDNPRLLKNVNKDLSKNDFSVADTMDFPTKGKIVGDLGDWVKVSCTVKDGSYTYSRETVSNRNTGEYRLILANPSVPAMDKCTLKAEAEGYTFEPASIEINVGEKREFPDIKATKIGDDKGLNISGMVFYDNRQGKVIPGIEVKAVCLTGGKEETAKTIKGTTNAKGVYTLANITKGDDCTVTASGKGLSKEELTFVNLPKKFTNFQKSTDFDIFAKKGSADDKTVKLSGTAKYETKGNVIGGVKVVVKDCVSEDKKFTKDDTTAADGTYAITGIPKGLTCNVEVSKQGLKFKKNKFSLKFDSDQVFNPLAEDSVAEESSCKDLGKGIAEDKTVFNWADVNEGEKLFLQGNTKVVDLNCDGKFTYADVIGLVQCQVQGYKVSCK